MIKSHNKKSASLIRRIIDFHQEKSQAINLTKLYQLLYLIDFGHHALYGTKVSHFEYLRHSSELIVLGAMDYIQLPLYKTEAKIVQEPTVAYITPDVLPDTVLSVIEKTLTFLCAVSEKEIHRIIGYHPTWIVACEGKILAIKSAENCDFEWLGYFSGEMTREEYEALEKLRRKLENSDRMKGLEARLKKIEA